MLMLLRALTLSADTAGILLLPGGKGCAQRREEADIA